VDKNEIFGSLRAASTYVASQKLNPFYILTDDARTDFPPNETQKAFDSVVVGLAPEKFDYGHINHAFQILHQSAGSCPLIAIHEGKYYKTKKAIDVGPGCFIKGLEYSAGVKAICIGKPTEHFFKSALPEGVKPENAVMIGDDPIDDCMGAMRIGMRGFLVETGKYQPDQYEGKPLPATSGIFKSFSDVVDHLYELSGQ
jgi:HAD superfamily hydrolase (TIGR01458 family)